MRSEIDSAQAILPCATADVEAPAVLVTEARRLMDAGIESARSGDRAGARTQLLRATELDPGLDQAWLWLASISEYPEELLEFLDRVLELDPENARALEWRSATNALLSRTLVQRARDAAEAADKESAIEHYSRALEFDDQNTAAWIGLASLAESSDSKIVYLEKALELEPENEYARAAHLATVTEIREQNLAEAKAAAVRGRLTEANVLLNEVLAKDPECIEAWTLRSLFSQTFTGKLEAFERLVQLDPGNPAAEMGLASLRAVAETARVEVEPPAPVEHLEAEPEGMAVAEVIRTDEEFEPAKSPTQDLEMPEGVVEAFGIDIEAEAEVLVPESEFDSNVNGGNEAEAEPSATVWAPEPYIAEPFVDEAPEPSDADVQSTFEQLEEAYHNVHAVEPEQPEHYVNGFDPFATVYRSEVLDLVAPLPEAEEFAAAEISEDAPTYHTEQAADAFDPTPELPSIPMPEAALEIETAPAADAFATRVAVEEADVPMARFCDFCDSANAPDSNSCGTCRAVLTLDDIEQALTVDGVDREPLYRAIARLEGERSMRVLREDELVTLAVGYLNLKEYDHALSCLQEASLANPSNVILAGQVNILDLRVKELKEMEEERLRRPVPKGKTILVVDDSPTILKLIAGKLESFGHEVFCSHDGESALELIGSLVPDLVLVDINMPKMDGYEVCRRIRKISATHNVPVVMISGKDGFFDKELGMSAGASGYITKPFGPETLMKAVESHLMGSDGWENAAPSES